MKRIVLGLVIIVHALAHANAAIGRPPPVPLG